MTANNQNKLKTPGFLSPVFCHMLEQHHLNKIINFCNKHAEMQS